MTPKQILIAARALIEKPEHWTQGMLAKGKRRATHVDSKSAICFCTLGALERVRLKNKQGFESTIQSERLLSAAADGEYVHVYNDTHTHAEVLAMFDRAIEAAE